MYQATTVDFCWKWSPTGCRVTHASGTQEAVDARRVAPGVCRQYSRQKRRNIVSHQVCLSPCACRLVTVTHWWRSQCSGKAVVYTFIEGTNLPFIAVFVCVHLQHRAKVQVFFSIKNADSGRFDFLKESQLFCFLILTQRVSDTFLSLKNKRMRKQAVKAKCAPPVFIYVCHNYRLICLEGLARLLTELDKCKLERRMKI